MNKYEEEAKSKRATSASQIRLSLALIIIVAVFFTLINWDSIPTQFPGSRFFEQFRVHLGLDLQGGTHLVYQADLKDIGVGEKNTALEGARDVIERRVNAMGVAEPVVQTAKQSGNYRIIIELAGIQNVSDAIDRIGETPLLEFKEVADSATSTAPTHDEIALREELDREKEELAIQILQHLQDGDDFGELAREFSDDELSRESGGELGWLSRSSFSDLPVEGLATLEQALFDEMIPGEVRDSAIKTELGYHIIKKNEERTDENGEQEVNSAQIFLRTQSLDQDEAIQWKNTTLSGKHLEQAQVVFEPQSNVPQVNLSFDNEGSKLFEEITERNIGQPVGIFLDGSPISAPIVQTAISGGHAVISGSFDLTEAKLLAQRLNAGALPVPIELINQQTVGASLGHDSLIKSLNAGIVGLILIGFFMIVYYRVPGIISVLALVLYIIIVLGIFRLIPVTLTLAGVAGFILSVGMAVDANVLIFERFKEELRSGETLKQAVETGFQRAWLSIRDSNISSLITVVILYWFGSSIIRGFAVTLGIGILISMFSAITVTRTLLRITVKRKLLQSMWIFGINKK